MANKIFLPSVQRGKMVLTAKTEVSQSMVQQGRLMHEVFR